MSNGADPVVADGEILRGEAEITADEEILVAQSGQVPAPTARGKASPQLKRIHTLVVFDAGDKAIVSMAPVFGKQVLKMGAKEVRDRIKGVNTLGEFAKLLKEYQSIDRMVLLFHGMPGTIRVGSDVRSLAHVDAVFAGHKPKITEINFEACNVGKGADELVPFGNLFQVSRIAAWNYPWVFGPIRVVVPRNADVKALEQELAPYSGYFLPGTASAKDLAKRPDNYTLFREWFHLFGKEKLPELESKRRSFKKRTDAKDVHIKASQVGELIRRYERNPSPPLERVTLEFSR